jgi:hypothetical protein
MSSLGAWYEISLPSLPFRRFEHDNQVASDTPIGDRSDVRGFRIRKSRGFLSGALQDKAPRLAIIDPRGEKNTRIFGCRDPQRLRHLRAFSRGD